MPTLKDRAQQLVRCHEHEIVGPILMLIASGILGIVMWPPPGMEVYATLIAWTGIASPMGGVIRIVIGVSAIAAWLSPWPTVRRAAYTAVALCVMLLALALHDTGQGFAAGAWGAAFIRSLRSILATERDAYAAIDPVTKRFVERAVSEALERVAGVR